MAEYLVEITGSQTLSAIDSAIRFEEQSPASFVKCSISFHDGNFTNIVKFTELPDADNPKQFKLQLAATPPPAGFNVVWTGPMIVQGSNQMVTGFRKS